MAPAKRKATTTRASKRGTVEEPTENPPIDAKVAQKATRADAIVKDATRGTATVETRAGSEGTEIANRADRANQPDALFYPFRALGYVTESAPFCVNRRGTESFVTVSAGKAFQIFNCEKMRLVMVGPQLREDEEEISEIGRAHV